MRILQPVMNKVFTELYLTNHSIIKNFQLFLILGSRLSASTSTSTSTSVICSTWISSRTTRTNGSWRWFWSSRTTLWTTTNCIATANEWWWVTCYEKVKYSDLFLKVRASVTIRWCWLCLSESAKRNINFF